MNQPFTWQVHSLLHSNLENDWRKLLGAKGIATRNKDATRSFLELTPQESRSVRLNPAVSTIVFGIERKTQTQTDRRQLLPARVSVLA